MYEHRTLESWSDACHIVMRPMNSHKHSVTGLTPTEIITPLVDTNAGILYPCKKSNSDNNPDYEEMKEQLPSCSVI
jgi:hypothetical protein